MMHNTGITAATAENAALSIDGSQPVWMTLNEARERAFTGEIVFESDPEVHAYLDNGIVYYAESISDASLGRRLLDAGVIDVAQLERGTVRVGDIEHLGRLFDRDPSIDRDAVVVVAEASTEELIADLANRAITTARVTAYRHHPSGVHRWFVAPLDPATLTRPISAVSQLDSAVVDDLPGLPFADVDDLTIEWDDDLDQGTDHAARIEEFDLSLLDVLSEPETEEPQELDADVVELSLDLAEFTDDLDETDDGDEIAVDEIAVDEIAVDAAELDIAELAEAEAETEAAVETEPVVENETGSEADAEQATDLADFEFAVVWPDGSEELATDGTDYVDGSLVESAPTDVDSSDETVDAVLDVVVEGCRAGR